LSGVRVSSGESKSCASTPAIVASLFAIRRAQVILRRPIVDVLEEDEENEENERD
jgi:hypothetical protein